MTINPDIYKTEEWKLTLSPETWDLLLKIVGDTGENEGADDVIKRIAKFYLDKKEPKQ